MRTLQPFFFIIIAFVLNISAEKGAAAQAKTGISDVVAIGKNTITIQNAKSSGYKYKYKVTNIDSDGKITRKPPSDIVTYKVDSFTVIIVDGLKSKLSDVKAGMKAEVEIGMDPSVLANITAFTPLPPPKPVAKGATPVPIPIGVERVLAISSDRITIGSWSNTHPRAYFITPHTIVKLDGSLSDLKAIRVGMSAHIIGDETTASEIDIHKVIDW